MGAAAHPARSTYWHGWSPGSPRSLSDRGKKNSLGVVKLRYELAQRCVGVLPKVYQLPAGYELELVGDREQCDCGGRFCRVRSTIHYPIGLMLGCPRVRLIDRRCRTCGQIDRPRDYYQHIPRGGNYAYDLIVEVGLARFRDYQQDAEIQKRISQQWGLSIPLTTIGSLANSFLDGLAAVHQAHAPALRERLAQDGGYAMHVDGTCEADTDVLFTAMAEPRGWTLEVARMATENQQEIAELMRRGVERFGTPLAVVRDLSPNIEKAKHVAIPQARDLICHYHFLENVGERLCEKHHSKLGTALRRCKIRASLRSIRKDLVRWSRKGERLMRSQIDQVLSQPDDLSELDPMALRRMVAYALLRWLDDYTADLQGEYFPFDLPNLAYYRRGRQLAEMVAQLVSLPDFPRRELSTLKTIARHLAPLCEDTELVTVAIRLEKATALFQELRKLLRLTSRPGERLLRGRGGQLEPELAQQMEGRLRGWREKLQQRHDRERDEDQRIDQAIVLNYLKKYATQLVGHVIAIKGRAEPFIALRTNNPPEHRFKSLKQGVRRRLGFKTLRRQIQAMRPETLLVCNLVDREYVNLVLDGSLANLACEIAKHNDAAQVIRKQRLAATTEHPIPVTKKQTRQPKFLGALERVVIKIIDTIRKTTEAA